MSVVGDETWTDYRFSVAMKMTGVGSHGSGPMFRVVDPDNYYLFEVSVDASTGTVWRRSSGAWQNLGSGSLPFDLSAGSWHLVTVEVRGDTFTGLVDSWPILQVTDSTVPAGACGLNAGDEVFFDDVLVASLGSLTNRPPIATASADVSEGAAPLVVHFEGTGSDPDGTVVTQAWAFGDGETTTELSPTHTFHEPGSHLATLTVTDNEGAVGTASVTVVVFESTGGGGGLSGTCGCGPRSASAPWLALCVAAWGRLRRRRRPPR